MSTDKQQRKLMKDLLDYLNPASSGELNNLRERLESILTPSELTELPNRLAIIKQIKAGVPQHKIAENLGVGVATVTRGALAIKNGQFANVPPYSNSELAKLWPSGAK